MAVSEVYNEDCLLGMARYPDNYFDLAIVDPPYGINADVTQNDLGGKKGFTKNAGTYKKYHQTNWDNEIPTLEYFEQLKRVSKNQIIWGGNYFTDFLKPTNSWIFWYKEPNGDNLTFSDGELAWTSFTKQLKQISIPWIGFGSVNLKEKKTHPAQKPVKLYDWILHNYAKEGDLILDTHLGSGSSRIACYDMGFDFVGFELDTEYFEKGNKRFEDFKSQLKLF